MSEFARQFHPKMGLTERELDVLKEIRSGSTLRDVSLALRVSQNTVKNHLRNIIEKLRLFGGLDA